MSRSAVAAALALAFAAGCGAAAPPPPAESTWLKPSEGVKDVASGSSFEAFFPLVDGMVYTYTTMNEVGEEGMLVARVFRADKARGELRFPSGARRFEYVADGVKVTTRDGAGYVLKAPLQVGTQWRGEHGGLTQIFAVDARVETPAGPFTGCVTTREERLGDRPVRYATTFCPQVGVVMLEVATGANYERATLKSYAAPLQMKPDGVERIPVGPQPPPVVP